MRGRMKWAHAWGVFHDEWNALKDSAKKSSSGRIWNSIVKFSGLANLHISPFKSGAWGRQMQEVHQKQVAGLLSPTSDEFNDAAQNNLN